MSTITRPAPAADRPRPVSGVELHSGDHLDRRTFHRLYEKTPESFKAELVGGVVYVASPVSLQHGDPHGTMVGWLLVYEAQTPGVRKVVDGTVYLTANLDEVQPDGMLFIRPELGGQARYEDEYVAGGPEFVIEIATSSAAIDLHDKRDAYERAGVREYVVLATKEPTLFWHENQNGKLIRLETPADGVFRSKVFPGLWLEASAALANDSKRLLDTLNAGLADPAHQAFIAELAARRA